MPIKTLTTLLCVSALSACTAIDRAEPGTVLLRGKIDAAMADRVRQEIAAGQRHFTIDSDGGFVGPALQMRLMVSESASTVVASRRCISACVYVLMGSPNRQAEPGTVVAFHDWSSKLGAPVNVNAKPLTRAEMTQLGIR